jgi:hypothetical protein
MKVRVLALTRLTTFVAFIIGGCVQTARQEDDGHLLALKSKCREDGDKARQEWARTYFGEQFSKEPEYAYSPSLKTCIWLGEYWGPASLEPGEIHVRFILDVYSNKILIEYTALNGKQIGDVSAAEFERMRMDVLGLDKPGEPQDETERQLRYRP